MPQKDNILLLLFPGSHALPVTGTESMLFQFILQLNISVTNISVYGTTFGQLSPKCSGIIRRYFILYGASNCVKCSHTVGNTGIYCKFHSHFSFTLIYYISLFISTSLHLSLSLFSLHFRGNELLSTVTGLRPRIHFQQVNCFRMSSLTGTNRHNEYKERHSLLILLFFLCQITACT